MRLLDLAKSVHAGKRDQNDASGGRAGVNDYVDAVRLANGKASFELRRVAFTPKRLSLKRAAAPVACRPHEDP
jgi:hypothetical protein